MFYSIIMIMETYDEPNSKTDTQIKFIFFTKAFITVSLIVEMMFKFIVLGVLVDEGTYFRKKRYNFEFLIVFIFISDLLLNAHIIVLDDGRLDFVSYFFVNPF